MAGIALTGLASGLDVESIISKLMEVERAPKARLEKREGQVKARGEMLRDIQAKLQTVSDAAGALRSVGVWSEVQSVESSDPTRVAAKRLSGTGPGGYQIEVAQLASAEQRTFAFTASGSASQLTINGVTVELGAGATLEEAAQTINANSETGVYAVASGGKLILSSRETGAEHTISAGGATIEEEAAKLKAGRDAEYSVDGVAATSSSNLIGEAVPGLELTLKSPTSGPVTVTVGNPEPNHDEIKEKLKAFVSAYNAAVEAIHSRLAETRVANPGSQAEANRGALFGDSGLSSLLSQMREFVAESGLSELGLSTGAPTSTVSAESDSVIGKLVFDESKLEAALEAEPAAMKKLVAGFSESFEDLLEPTLEPTGTMASRIEAVSSETKRLSESMSALDERLTQREERLHLQYASLEALLSKSESEAAWLTSQLEKLG